MTEAIDFIHELTWSELPDAARTAAVTVLTDTLGVAIAARRTALSRIIHDHAVRFFGGDTCHLWQDGRRASPLGAALANGMTIDAVDAHDGHKLTKGHVGCGVVPALVAMNEALLLDDPREFLTTLVMAYEIGSRAGIALHASACDYHTSGAWISVASAAVAARALGLSRAATREALGIAEYHGPRSQMMRCIDHPTMVKDGSGWGSMAGISAGYLAADGFTGAPAVTVEGSGHAALWGSLGRDWEVTRQYVKLYPVCRWAQPAVEAVLAVLRPEPAVTPGDIASIRITTFHEATRLSVRHPASTEEAQYSLPFPVAAAILRGTIGVAEVTPPALEDPEILALSDRIEMVESDAFNDAFPAERLAQAEIRLADGRQLVSGVTSAKGDPEDPLSRHDLQDKYHRFADPVLGAQAAESLRKGLEALPSGGSLQRVLDALATPG